MSARSGAAGTVRLVGPAMLVRLATLPVGAAATAVSAYLTIQYAGVPLYGFISLLGLLFLLLPFADLGLGAAVVNSVASRGSGSDRTQSHEAVINQTFRLLAGVGIGGILATGVLSLGDVWQEALGAPDALSAHLNTSAFVTLGCFFLALPLGIGQRILIGLGRNAALAFIALLGPVVTVGWSALIVITKAPALLMAAGPALGVFIVSLCSLVVGLRSLGLRLRPWSAVRPRPELAAAAMPFLVITIGMPLATQSDRLVISHQASASALASYSLAAQLYAPALSVVTAGSTALWSAYVERKDDLRSAWHASLRVLGVIGLVIGTAYAVLADLVGGIVSRSEINISWPLALAFASLLAVMSVHQASAMLLTQPRGLAFQAKGVVVMLAVNLPLSIWWAGQWGAPGPVVASVIGLSLFVLLPSAWLARRTVGPPAATRSP